MAGVVVVGAQWGDEGKGKIVDWLCHRADVVVRFQGGHNAGHTLVVGNTTYKLALLPSGVVQGKLSIIGNGVVVDPWALASEIEKIEAQGVKINTEKLVLSDQAALILPFHRDLDAAREAQAGAASIGTTQRGIGPAYEDKVGRRAIRVADLADPKSIEWKIGRLTAHHNALRKGLDLPEIDVSALKKELAAIAPKVLPYAQPAWRVLNAAFEDSKRVLFEGAQGMLLDVDHGTYPFVTSSHCSTLGIPAGTGVPPTHLRRVVGIMKAYSTRVGAGPFPTEQDNAIGQRIREAGREYGTTTGRPRRCGWLDLVAVRYSAMIAGATEVACMLLDVLAGLGDLKIAVTYRAKDGSTTDRFPPDAEMLAQMEPIYETLPGWDAPTTAVQCRAELPRNAAAYLARVEEFLGIPISIISVGPDRTQTLLD